MSITENIRHLKRIIPDNVLLMAVSKGQPISAIEEAFAAGICDFGENYWQEAQLKIQALQKLSITWHFIGPLQSNKASAIANHMDWVHSVDREKIAHLLAEFRPTDKPPLNICIQVNLDKEVSKSGVDPTDIRKLAKTILSLSNLKLRGLMAIPKPQKTVQEQYESFQRLTQLLQETNTHLPYPMDTLSMGMTDDYKPAIKAGSTLIRIGRAIFGDRS